MIGYDRPGSGGAGGGAGGGGGGGGTADRAFYGQSKIASGLLGGVDAISEEH